MLRALSYSILGNLIRESSSTLRYLTFQTPSRDGTQWLPRCVKSTFSTPSLIGFIVRSRTFTRYNRRCPLQPSECSQSPKSGTCLRDNTCRHSHTNISIFKGILQVSFGRRLIMTVLISFRSNAKFSFLFESAATTETIGRYSFVGASGIYPE